MAKQSGSYLGGFSGKLGPAIGYLWNGKWCVRSRPTAVRNPRSEKQMECRSMFKQQVQLAARMRWAVLTGLGTEARRAGMTAYNMFVSINQPCFAPAGGAMAIDYTALRLSLGPVAPVAFEEAHYDEGGVLTVSFEKNPLRMRANAFDEVRLYVYAPNLGYGYLSAPVYRRSKNISVCLPETFDGQEVYLYGMVQDEQGRMSDSIYAGNLLLDPTGTATESQTPAIGTTATPSTPTPIESTETPLATAANDAPDAPPPVAHNQLSLW